MAFKQVGPLAAVTNTNPKVLGTVDLGSRYCKVIGFYAHNWASSAKAGDGTDAAEIVELKDADGVIFYLDAADRDYKTAPGKKVFFKLDDTVTGLNVVGADATGAAAGATTPLDVVVKGPVTVTIRNCGTATDYFEIYLIVDTGRSNS